MSRDILIVDDEQDIRMLVAGILEDEGYSLQVAENSDVALSILEASPPPALVILDIWMQGSSLDGMELLKLLRHTHPELPIIMISGHGNIETAVSAIKLGAYDFIEKPFKADRLLLQVSRALEATDLRRENKELKLRMGPKPGLIGSSSSISGIQSAISKIAPTGSRIMITGPAGSGKEVIARIIHDNSYRNNGPFVVVNSSMMRPDRLETELFGTEQGYPDTGNPRRVGTFERAHSGTLFFDEVADMPLETQGKMVRVIQEQSFERVGGSTRVEVDVRVISASNRDLAEEIRAKRFREDLFYRLNVVPIVMPALSDRREDIPELARHFMQRAAGSSGLPPREIAADAMAVLQSCDWPGNVRQLRNVVESMVVVDDDVDVSDLEEVIWAACTRCDPATNIGFIRGAWSSSLDPMISPEQRKAGNLTNSRAIINACRPFHWKDDFQKVNAPSPEARREAWDRWGYLRGLFGALHAPDHLFAYIEIFVIWMI